MQIKQFITITITITTTATATATAAYNNICIRSTIYTLFRLKTPNFD